jgi:hypothetical protein
MHKSEDQKPEQKTDLRSEFVQTIVEGLKRAAEENRKTK